MDFYLICAQIQELLIKNERVVLPGTGEFVVESFPAAFLEDGKTIVPPSKKLRFIPVTGEETGKAASEEQEAVLVELSGRIREALVQDGEFEVPGFGIFADNGAGEVKFTLAEGFDFAPDNFALESISLEENELVEETVAPQETVAEEPTAEEPLQEPETPGKIAEPLKTTPAKEQEVHDVAAKKETRRKWMMWAITAAVFLAVVVLFMILFKEDMKGILQNLLYTKEELEIMQKWAAQ
ncbi:MAG: hypothetical protein IJE52_01005 [Bacteroidales bacterium]|nr:hypothetical protein [Bacteroidales bacterium]